jgi:hypothetical protein
MCASNLIKTRTPRHSTVTQNGIQKPFSFVDDDVRIFKPLPQTFKITNKNKRLPGCPFSPPTFLVYKWMTKIISKSVVQAFSCFLSTSLYSSIFFLSLFDLQLSGSFFFPSGIHFIRIVLIYQCPPVRSLMPIRYIFPILAYNTLLYVHIQTMWKRAM